MVVAGRVVNGENWLTWSAICGRMCYTHHQYSPVARVEASTVAIEAI